jgi:hypothetical protein
MPAGRRRQESAPELAEALTSTMMRDLPLLAVCRIGSVNGHWYLRAVLDAPQHRG